MSRQHWKVSLLESLTNTGIGLIISLAVWYTIRYSGHYDIQTTVYEGFQITAIFTLVSIIRGFGLRRFYEWLHVWLHRNIEE